MSGSPRFSQDRFAGFFLHLTCLAMAGFLALAASPAWAQPFRLGDRPPTPEEEAYLDQHMVEVSQVEPNALSRARAVADALDVGLSPAATDALPTVVDNSLSIYFPPIRSQGGQGSCTCWAACYYYNTYTQARDEGYTVSGGNNAYISSPAFMYPLINGGNDYGASTSYAVTRLNDIGCCSWATKPYSDSDYLTWPTEAAWIEALQWRTQTAHSINGYTQSGIDAIKQHLANGNVAATRFTVYDNFWQYPNKTTGINNRVYYAPNGDYAGGHAVTLIGYDDNKSYVDHRDGQVHYGAFLLANSWGSTWGWYNSTGGGSKGYFWVAYQMFLDWDFGPYAYYNDDRPQYEPSFYAVTGINHAERGRVSYRAGIGTTGSPEFNGPYPINQDGGNDEAITDAKRVAVDLTDGVYLLVPGAVEPVFSEVYISSHASSNGTITSADFALDIEGDGTYQTFSSSDPVVTVPPVTTGYATAVVTTVANDIYVDDSNTSGPWDGTIEHPFRTIQDGVDVAYASDTVWVFPGTYTERVTVPSGMSLIGAGADSTIIDSQNTGSALLISGATGAFVRGFTLTSSGTSYTAMASTNSTATLRDCIASNSRSGFGGGQTGSLTLENCLSFGHLKQGVWEDGSADVTIRNMTIADNADCGVVHWGTGTVMLTNSIVWGNADDVRGAMTAWYCDISDGDFSGYNGNFSQDPLFVSGPLHAYYLSQIASGQASTSPCVNVGSDTAVNAGLDHLTTRTDSVLDTGTLDLGYHAERPLHITDVSWNHGLTSVVITFTSVTGVDYVVEAADADAYADDLTWSVLMSPTAGGLSVTVYDDLTTNPLGAAFRFYRVKCAEEFDCSPETAGVHEITLDVVWPIRNFLVSTPLIPDPDHAGVQDVLGVQLDYANVTLDKLTADTGLYTRATYAPGAGWANVFPIVAGEAYMLYTGDALPMAHTLRLTGMVPETPLTVPLMRASFAVTHRWMAYSMPRPTTLGALGLETAITPFWEPTNEVRLLPLGSSIWSRYQWDGLKWYDLAAPGVDAGATPIACGQGIVFIHNGIPGQPDVLTRSTWYACPPNVW